MRIQQKIDIFTPKIKQNKVFYLFLCALKEKDELKLFSKVIYTTLTMLWIQLNLERSFWAAENHRRNEEPRKPFIDFTNWKIKEQKRGKATEKWRYFSTTEIACRNKEKRWRKREREWVNKGLPEVWLFAQLSPRTEMSECCCVSPYRQLSSQFRTK